jgi:hypothetical protein
MADASFTDEQLREMLGSSLSNDLGMGTANTAGSGLLNSLLGGVNSFLGGTGGQILGTGLGIDALNEMRGLGKEAQTEALRIGERAQADTAFKPFSISTGFGGVSTDPTGGFSTTLAPEQEALRGRLSGITGGLTGGFGMGTPDISGIQGTALGGIEGLLAQAQGSTAGREQDIYNRIRATQLPEEQRQQLALNEQLASQGRTGLRTAMFGGSPEQFAMEKARAEAMNQASLASIGQAQAQREADLAAATGMFGLGSSASFLPSGLREAELGNIGASMGLGYQPERELLASLTPALSLADLAGTGQREGAGLFAEAGMSGLAERLGAEKTRTEGLAGLYNSLINAQGNVAGASASSAGSTAGNVANALLGFLSKER